MPGENPLRAGWAVSGGHRDSARRPAFGGRKVRGWLAGGTALSGLVTPLGAALAQEVSVVQAAGRSVGTAEVIQLAVFAGVVGAALLSAVWLIRERARTAQQNIELRSRLVDANAALQRYEALVNLRDQRLIAWSSDNKKPELIGTLPPESGAPEERAAFMAFGRWLTARSAASLDSAIAALRERSAAFDLVVETHNGSPLEVQGRKNASHLFVRFVSLSEAQRTQARLRLENQRLAADLENALGLADALDMPFWTRAADGSLKWVNRAYARAVEARDAGEAVREGREFLGTQTRAAVSQHHQSKPVFEQSVSTVIDGDRRVFLVTDFASGDGSAGIAVDRSGEQAVREEYERTVRSHADTLDQLTTAVAIFDEQQKLRFFNQAFQKLWELDTPYLESAPEHALMLDRLRSDGKLAESPEWRRWKEGVLSAYRAVEPQEHWWHLPDGQTIRVVGNPQPKGGVTWVFENLTEKMDLESRYQTAVRVQGETLDNLAEGVAVFGPDGRVRLSNPAFARLWGLHVVPAGEPLHVNAIAEACAAMAKDSPWPGFLAAITGFEDERKDRRGLAELNNGTMLRYAVINLPNGQVMLTFVDVTDSVNVERALKEKNEALQRSDQLKNDFVQHVSYELRSPLTNIIGFTELLALPGTGPLTPKQKEYLEHIGSSSSVLLTIVNDILDLATVDAGIMELEIGEVPVARALETAAELVADRFVEHGITLDVDLTGAPATFRGDETRVRQILYNLLSNAANYAPDG
ncbi:MAG: PAS-domain containing protein, partial [Rhizobiaceae bacterium]|nr:PAS-domain containing protein [Rhizobiaceae bacterium]